MNKSTLKKNERELWKSRQAVVIVTAAHLLVVVDLPVLLTIVVIPTYKQPIVTTPIICCLSQPHLVESLLIEAYAPTSWLIDHVNIVA